jgi:hypothetical protein
LPVKKEIFLIAAQFQKVLKQVAGEFQQSQPIADFPEHLETEAGKNQHLQNTE